MQQTLAVNIVECVYFLLFPADAAYASPKNHVDNLITFKGDLRDQLQRASLSISS